MTCVHLKELFQLCDEKQLKIGGSDIIRVVCTQCGEQEVCPDMLADEYDLKNQTNSQQAAAKKTESSDSA